MTGYLEISKLNVSYGNTAVLFDIDLSAQQGDFVAIAGPSGCGKTTLLRTILGLERAHSGTIRLGQSMITIQGINLAPEKRNIGWVPQDSALFPMLTVAENIAFSLAKSPRSVKKQAGSERVDQMLELINLTALRNRMPSELSGGQAQRVALARALAGQPQLVLMDEPFAGLDPVLRSDLRQEVKAILKANLITALLVTHDQTEALSIADTVAVLHRGRIEQVGTPEEVYTTPATQWVANFLGDANHLVGHREGDYVTTLLGSSEFMWMGEKEPQDVIDVMVRPEFLELTSTGQWKVVAVEYCGHDALLSMKNDAGNTLDVRVSPDKILGIGERAGISLTRPVLAYPAMS